LAEERAVKDGRKSPLGMPTMKDNRDKAEKKHPHKPSKDEQGLGRFLWGVLLVSISAFLIVLTLVLWPGVPTEYSSAILSTLTNKWVDVGITVSFMVIGVSVTIRAFLPSRRKVPGSAPAESKEANTESPVTPAGEKWSPSAELERRESAAQSSNPSGSSTAQLYRFGSAPPLICKVCGVNFKDEGKNDWFAAVEHIHRHLEELRLTFRSWQPEEEMERLFKLFFTEGR